MTLSTLMDTIDDAKSMIDELSHIPEDVRNSLIGDLEDFQERLDGISDEYGDEPIGEYDEDDE